MSPQVKRGRTDLEETPAVCQKLVNRTCGTRMGRLQRTCLLSRRECSSCCAWLDKAGRARAFSHSLNSLTKIRLLPKEHAPIHHYGFEAGITCSSMLVLVRQDAIPLLVLVAQGHLQNIFLLVYRVDLLSGCLYLFQLSVVCISKGISGTDTYRMLPSGIHFQWKVAEVEDNDNENGYDFTAFVIR